jgi:hypothetical protein
LTPLQKPQEMSWPQKPGVLELGIQGQGAYLAVQTAPPAPSPRPAHPFDEQGCLVPQVLAVGLQRQPLKLLWQRATPLLSQPPLQPFRSQLWGLPQELLVGLQRHPRNLP